MKQRYLRKTISVCLALILLLGSVPAGAQADSTDAFAQKLEGMYDSIDIEYRPEHRWWLAEGLNTDETLRKNVKEMYDAGFGAFEFLAMPEPSADSTIYGWGSEEWTSDTRLLIEEASKYGMGFSMTSGTHWGNANLPDTWSWEGVPYNPDNKAASKELDYVTLYLQPGEHFEDVLPFYAGSANEIINEYIFQGAVAARLITPRAEAAQDFEYMEGTGTGVLDLESIQDLSGRVVENDGVYSLAWDAPEDGEYALFVFWLHGTGRTAEPSVSTNYTVNYIDSYGMEALMDYWEEVILTEELKELIRQNGRGEIYMDSLELSARGAAGLLWGYNFKEEFLTRRGYDVTPYLPLMTLGRRANTYATDFPIDYTVEGKENLAVVEKVRNDLYQTLTDMYLYNVLEPLQTWLHSLNMKLRAEPSYGQPFEISLPARFLDDVETESYAQNADTDLYRGFLGSANMYGRLLSSETGATSAYDNVNILTEFGPATSGWNYRLNMDYWTSMFYQQFAAGVNRTVTHGYSAIEGSEEDTYWPGHEGMYARISERFNSRQPASTMYPAWTEMLSRNQKVLRQGQPQRDIAIMRTGYDYIRYGHAHDMELPAVSVSASMYDSPYLFKDVSLQQNGYTYDYFSPQILEDEENVSWTSEVLQPDGPSYQAIILYQGSLELSSAKKILEIAKDGLPVLFVNNAAEAQFSAAGTDIQYDKAAGDTKFLNDSETQLNSVVAQIKALPNAAEVENEAQALNALRGLGVYPRVGYDRPNRKIMTISRLDKENNIAYTFAYSNKFYVDRNDAPYTFELVFEGAGKPYIMDDWTGRVSEAGVYNIVDGYTHVPMTLAVGEAAIVVLDLSNSADSVHAVKTTANAVITDGGKGYIVASKNGTYQTELNDGTVVDSVIDELPAPIALDKWDIIIEDWNEGEKIVNTEEKFGHVTTEVYYTTKKTNLEFTDAALVPWKDLPATSEQLAALTTVSGNASAMANVSGIGTYKTSFEVPAGFTAANGAYLTLTSTGGGSAQVFVNGTEAKGLDLRTLKLDITDLLLEGTNTIEIVVASTLTNRMIERGYEEAGWMLDIGIPSVQDYGLQGEAKIVPYALAEVF